MTSSGLRDQLIHEPSNGEIVETGKSVIPVQSHADVAEGELGQLGHDALDRDPSLLGGFGGDL
jgi:hypothetical protein